MFYSELLLGETYLYFQRRGINNDHLVITTNPQST
jgi:hypothetical protein